MPFITSRLGSQIVKWATVATLFLLLSGIYLWWPFQRFTVQWKGPARRVWFDIHAVTGIFSFPFLLLLTVTGIMMSFEATTVPLLYKMTGSRQSPEPLLKVTPAPGAKPVSPDQAVEIARAALPGAAPYRLEVPGPHGAYTIGAGFPEDRTPGGRSSIVVDQYSGAVLFTRSSRNAPAGARIMATNGGLHTGEIWGAPGKAVLSLACLIAILQVISGFAMWWKKKSPRKVQALRRMASARSATLRNCSSVNSACRNSALHSAKPGMVNSRRLEK